MGTINRPKKPVAVLGYKAGTIAIHFCGPCSSSSIYKQNGKTGIKGPNLLQCCGSLHNCNKYEHKIQIYCHTSCLLGLSWLGPVF